MIANEVRPASQAPQSLAQAIAEGESYEAEGDDKGDEDEDGEKEGQEQQQQVDPAPTASFTPPLFPLLIVPPRLLANHPPFSLPPSPLFACRSTFAVSAPPALTVGEAQELKAQTATDCEASRSGQNGES